MLAALGVPAVQAEDGDPGVAQMARAAQVTQVTQSAPDEANGHLIALMPPSATYLIAAVESPQPAASPPETASRSAPASAPEPAPGAAPPPAEALTLKVEPRLVAQRPETDPAPAFLQGLKISGETGRVTVIEGDAEVRKRGTNIKADNITYHQVEDQLQAAGNVRIYREGDLFTGTTLDLKLDARTGFLLKSTYLLANDRARGSAERMEFLGKDNYRGEDAVYTTCGPGDDDWYLKVKELKLDYGRDAGEVTNAQLNFLGMHILTVPSMSFALNARRKSGFLTPSFGSTIEPPSPWVSETAIGSVTPTPASSPPGLGS